MRVWSTQTGLACVKKRGAMNDRTTKVSRYGDTESFSFEKTYVTLLNSANWLLNEPITVASPMNIIYTKASFADFSHVLSRDLERKSGSQNDRFDILNFV